jgi:putative molybdopterin biosynthesis protein
MPESQQALKVRDVALRLNVRAYTVHRLIREGDLLAFKVGRQWRVEERDLKAYIRRQKKKEAWRERVRRGERRENT